MAELQSPEQLIIDELFEPVQLTLGRAATTVHDTLYRGKYGSPPDLPSHQTIVDRMVGLYDSAVADDTFDHDYHRRTYEDVNVMCHEWADTKINYDIFPDSFNYRSVAAVIATLSPREEWVKNQQRALRYIMTGEASGLSRAMKDLARLREGESADDVIADPNKNNPKIKAFYFNMADPHIDQGYVTVDSHMFNIAHDDPQLMGHLRVQRFKEKDYRSISAAIVAAAEQRGILSREMQSTTWYYWKRLHDVNDHSGQVYYRQELDLGKSDGVKNILVL